MSLTITKFFHSVSNLPITQLTSVEIERVADGLNFSFVCADDLFLENNFFTQNNSPLWQQEVLEVFIAAGKSTPETYFEFEINPNNAIFLAKVVNTDGTGAKNHLSMIEPTQFAINAKVEVDVLSKSWRGSFLLPFSLIGFNDGAYRINVFRIVRVTPPFNSQWLANPNDCVYACWKPTPGLQKPSFHRPASFALVQF